VAFVEKIEGLLEEVWGRENGSVASEVLERLWGEVLRVEEKFWPVV